MDISLKNSSNKFLEITHHVDSHQGAMNEDRNLVIDLFCH